MDEQTIKELKTEIQLDPELQAEGDLVFRVISQITERWNGPPLKLDAAAGEVFERWTRFVFTVRLIEVGLPVWAADKIGSWTPRPWLPARWIWEPFQPYLENKSNSE